MEQLARLRLQLTAWYAGVLGLVLLVLGVGLFLTVRRQMARHLDVSLRAAAAALEQAARIRETERAAAPAPPGAPPGEPPIPPRTEEHTPKHQPHPQTASP